MLQKRTPLIVGTTALLLVLAWQALTVHFNYGGNWSALFHIGDRWPLPPELTREGTYIFQDNPGYDGIFYHLAAHDPWLKREFWRFADNASLRWRRILIPALAHLAAFGADVRIHAAYISISLGFIFLGCWWLARFCRAHGMSAAWGFSFLSIPSVMVSVDRLTIDIALSALAIGFFVYCMEGKDAKAFAILTLCPLARETGLCITGGKLARAALDRDGKTAALSVASAVPFLLWLLYVFQRTPLDGTAWLSWPLSGIIHRTLQPIVYPITGRWVAAAAALDYLALLGIWAAFILAGTMAAKRKFGLLECCIYVFALGASLLGKADIWAGAYEFGRTMSPLLVLLGLCAIRDRNPWLLVPLSCTVPRILLQFEPQLRAILKQL